MDRSKSEVTTITWLHRNSDATSPVRVAVQIDDKWYVSNTPMVQGKVWAKTTFTWTTKADAWRVLNFTPGSKLSMNEGVLATPLPSGAITAFGLYFEQITDTVRIDEITINVLPVAERQTR